MIDLVALGSPANKVETGFYIPPLTFVLGALIPPADVP
jgi:hypothetical protein